MMMMVWLPWVIALISAIEHANKCNIGALIITYTFLGVLSFAHYGIMGPQNSVLITKAPILRHIALFSVA